MRRRHALAVSILVGVAVVVGALALVRTTAAPSNEGSEQVSDAWLAARTSQLDAYEASLDQALTTQPPALPQGSDPIRSERDGGGTQQVVYLREQPAQAQPAIGDDDDDGEEEHDDRYEREGDEDDD